MCTFVVVTSINNSVGLRRPVKVFLFQFHDRSYRLNEKALLLSLLSVTASRWTTTDNYQFLIDIDVAQVIGAVVVVEVVVDVAGTVVEVVVVVVPNEGNCTANTGTLLGQ